MPSLTLHNRINGEDELEYYVPCLQTNKNPTPTKSPHKNLKAQPPPNKTHSILQNEAEYQVIDFLLDGDKQTLESLKSL